MRQTLAVVAALGVILASSLAAPAQQTSVDALQPSSPAGSSSPRPASPSMKIDLAIGNTIAGFPTTQAMTLLLGVEGQPAAAIQIGTRGSSCRKDATAGSLCSVTVPGLSPCANVRAQLLDRRHGILAWDDTAVLNGALQLDVIWTHPSPAASLPPALSEGSPPPELASAGQPVFAEYTVADLGKPGVPQLNPYQLHLLRKIAKLNPSQLNYIRWTIRPAVPECKTENVFPIWIEAPGTASNQEGYDRVLDGPCNDVFEPGQREFVRLPFCRSKTPPIL